MPDEKLPFLLYFIILATEWHNSHCALFAGQLADAITMKSRAVDNEIGLKFASRGLCQPATSRLTQRYNLRARHYLPSQCGDPPGHRITHLSIINDPFLRHTQ